MYIACGGDAHKPAKYCDAYGRTPAQGAVACDAHILRAMYKACGHDAQIHRSTARPCEILRSTAMQIVKISEFYVDIFAILWQAARQDDYKTLH